ncbi:MAG TPA: hypothetical protein VFZ34_16625 [Blastocatellia bacterium]|nr:hypothetical protein [Blastocatellia bacterium]
MNFLFSRLLFTWFLLLFCSLTARADVSFFLQEAVGFAARWNSAGHASVHLSNVCTDNYTQLRPCRAGERGVVLSSFRDLGAEENYEWIAVPLVPFLYGVVDERDVPLYVNEKILAALRERYRRTQMLELIPVANDGYWQHLVGAALTRDIYAFTVTTTPEQDAAFIAAFNRAPNVNHFRQLSNNCTDFAARVLNQFYPNSARRDWLNDFGTITPQAIAKSFAKFAQKNPDLQLRVTRYTQAHGTLRRSQTARKLTQEALSSPKYLAPLLYWQPYIAAGFAGSYFLFGRFDPERAYRHQQAEQLPVLGTKQMWQQAQTVFTPVLQRAIADGVFTDARAVKTFFRALEQSGVPSFDEHGALVLKTNHATLGLTRDNILSNDQTLAQQLLLTKLQAELQAKAKNRDTYAAWQSNWTLLLTLRANAPTTP